MNYDVTVSCYGQGLLAGLSFYTFSSGKEKSGREDSWWCILSQKVPEVKPEIQSVRSLPGDCR
jgi:hypothetical protein